MADKIKIVGVKPYDGEYDLDFDAEPLNTIEWRWVKKIGGYLPLTMEDGWRGGDPDLFLAFAVIALCRAGQIDEQDGMRVSDKLARGGPFGTTITFLADEEEAEVADEDPPAGSEIESQKPSGGGSSSLTSVPSDADLPATGTPPSGMSATSAPETLAS